MSPVTDTEIFDEEAFNQALSQHTQFLPVFRKAIQNANQVLKQRFENNEAADKLVASRVWLVDQLLVRAYKKIVAHDSIALVAVGGYGRGELHPGSDVDILILLPESDLGSDKDDIEQYLTFLWDLGLDIGHSVRSVEDCVNEARLDITVVTNLLEARLLYGPQELFERMRNAVGPQNIWPDREFFQAKMREQIARHHKYYDTAYNLEPNIKEGPGGLRDIQTIGWVAKRHFGVNTLHGLVTHEFLTEAEYNTLMEGQNFLWKIRIGLHTLAHRREDRLLFDHQRTLACQFGFKDDGKRLAVEHFMKQYYRQVMELRRLNEMLLQLFEEAILYADDPGEPVPINNRFQSRKGFVEVIHPGIFKRYPFALMEIFLLLAQHPQLKGVRATTIRLIRDHRYLINDKFRNDLRCRSLFMELLRQPLGITHELRRMNRYSVLASYLPVFGNIVGQMQHDLFHHYTVDEHTLFVIRNLRRFTVPAFANEFPLCSKIIQNIPKPEILYLAGLFHDVAKGRGGDHSQLGAEDATAFCRHHGLSEYDAKLVAWLVQNHLLMSVTAQRKDTSDPEVIMQFAATIGNQVRLDYLYLLTVADIRATNPNLWNDWKDALLTELYMSSGRAFRRGLENPIEQKERRDDTQMLARQMLSHSDLMMDAVENLWSTFGEDYFVRHSADRVTWHTEMILHSDPQDLPLVAIYPQQQGKRSGMEIFIYAQDQDYLFASVNTALEQLGLNIVDARIITALNGFTLDTYIVLEDTGEAIDDPYRLREITEYLREKILDPKTLPKRVKRHIPRQLKHFHISTHVNFLPDPKYQRTIMEVITSDRPGLLSQISQALIKCEIRLKNAKIATFGERVEDIFFITNTQNQPIVDPEQLACLEKAISQVLSEQQ